MILLSIILPWLSFLLRGQILTGILCLVLQITLIGWIPAMIWSLVSLSNHRHEKRIKKMEKNIIESMKNDSMKKNL